MNIKTKRIKISTTKQLEFVDVTSEIEEFISEIGIKDGQAMIFCPHTTSAIVINHNESMLIQDMTRMLHKLAPIDEQYSHDMFELTKTNKSDGRSNGHSHCKQMFLGASVSLPIEKKGLILGERQSIFFVELDGARERDFIVQVMG